jgi:hypothetical protein
MADVFVLPHHHHPCHCRLNSLSNTYNYPVSNPSPLLRIRASAQQLTPQQVQSESHPQLPLPFPDSRDVGSSFSPLDGGIREGDPQGGTQDVGGPPGASQTETMTNVVVSFLPFLLR